jgi:ankyrin repeat protein
MDLIASLRSGKITAVRAAVKANPAQACTPRAIGEAGKLGFLEAIQFLVGQGADLNALWRGYRPLHSLIQEKPHGTQAATGERLACLEWMLQNGANPELTGAWPPARAVLVATWVGEEAYVDALLNAGARADGFVAAALGDTAGVKKALKSDPSFATARDEGGLTALQCCAASRMDAAKGRYDVAALLLKHGKRSKRPQRRAGVTKWTSPTSPPRPIVPLSSNCC